MARVNMKNTKKGKKENETEDAKREVARLRF